MHIDLPNGDRLIPNSELADKLGVVVRTLNNYDREGLPSVMIGGRKYRPLNESLLWITGRIRRRNPPRATRRSANTATATTAAT
jgi:hypothetical protein